VWCTPHLYLPSAWEAEAGILQVPGQPTPYGKTHSLRKAKYKKTEQHKIGQRN
jgi:hypothetical protein